VSLRFTGRGALQRTGTPEGNETETLRDGTRHLCPRAPPRGITRLASSPARATGRPRPPPTGNSLARFHVGQAEGADPRRVAGRALFEVIADVPDREVVGRVDGGLGVVLPAVRGRLRGLALDQDRLPQRQLARRVVGVPAGEALAGEVGRP